jgi:hypothetical protein
VEEGRTEKEFATRKLGQPQPALPTLSEQTWESSTYTHNKVREFKDLYKGIMPEAANSK